jgi:hypothetical protein
VIVFGPAWCGIRWTNDPPCSVRATFPPPKPPVETNEIAPVCSMAGTSLIEGWLVDEVTSCRTYCQGWAASPPGPASATPAEPAFPLPPPTPALPARAPAPPALPPDPSPPAPPSPPFRPELSAPSVHAPSETTDNSATRLRIFGMLAGRAGSVPRQSGDADHQRAAGYCAGRHLDALRSGVTNSSCEGWRPTPCFYVDPEPVATGGQGNGGAAGQSGRAPSAASNGSCSASPLHVLAADHAGPEQHADSRGDPSLRRETLGSQPNVSVAKDPKRL